MSIEATYKKLLIEEYIKNSLIQGIAIDGKDIEEELISLIENLDLSIPQFKAEDWLVSPNEESSANKQKETFNTIKKDLSVVYTEVMNLTQMTMDSFERWKEESDLLELQLIDLENQIESLLLLTQDTEGYFAFLVENFTNNNWIDPDYSDVEVNLSQNILELSSSSENRQKLFIQDPMLNKNLFFRVRSNYTDLTYSDEKAFPLTNIFDDKNDTFWKATVQTNNKTPVTCELLVKLGDSVEELSSIRLILTDSAESSPMTITPLYSTDNINFFQVPSSAYTQTVKSKAIFTFETIEAQWIKFILTKEGPDHSSSTGDNRKYGFEFGFSNIEFLSNTFDTETGQTLVTVPLWVVDENKQPFQFEKVSLEVCERLEEGTKIKYYIATSNDEEVPVSDEIWNPISPINETSPEYPQILDVGETQLITLGDNEDIVISYDKAATDNLINPAGTFHLISMGIDGNILDEEISVLSNTIRYKFSHESERILNYQIKLQDTGSGTGSGIEINERNLQIYRNIGEKGLDSQNETSYVRGTIRGWQFNNPWYYTTVLVLNPQGQTIDFGSGKNIYIDGVLYNQGTVILSGKTQSTTGVHTVQVHKDFWQAIPHNLTTLEEIKSADYKLYPYNHKLLIEGYNYPTSFSGEKIYTGVDLFAEHLMKKVSVFDFINNTQSDNYKVYALDLDAPNTHIGLNAPTRVFVIKSDSQQADSQYEKFMIQFSLINELRKFLRLKAVFTTTNSSITPGLFSYKIKLG